METENRLRNLAHRSGFGQGEAEAPRSHTLSYTQPNKKT